MKKMMILVLMVVLLSMNYTGEVAASDIEVQTVTDETDSYVVENITNSAGKKFELSYPEDVIFENCEECLLAKLAEYEGGTAEEKKLIMQTISSRKYNDEYPDDLKSIITMKGEMCFFAKTWNSINPSAETLEMAKDVLNSGVCSDYTRYTFKSYAWLFKVDESKSLTTEHYVFF